VRAILWARVSDPRRKAEERQQDVENQLIPLRAAATRLGWTVVREYRVDGSAWNKDPPEKAELMEELKRGGVDLVAVWDIDRYARKDPIAFLNELVELERHLGIHFFSLNQSFLSTATLDPSLRQVLIAFFAWISEAESRKRSERVKAAVATKRARAGNIGVDPKWGRGKIPSEETRAKILALRTTHPEWSILMIGREAGVSKSTAHRILQGAEGSTSSVPMHSA